MRAGRASLTAALVAAARAASSDVGPPLRAARDDVAVDLLPWLLARATPPVARLARSPLAFRALDRATFGLFGNVVLRTLRLDDLLAAAVEGGAKQLVVVGAGFDARAWRLPALAGTTTFEVDHPSTQAHKRERLGQRRSLAARVVFVSVDFERQSMEQELVRASFDPAIRSVWIWEGVTMYLTPEARRATIGAVGRLSAPGSEIFTTYATPDMLASPYRRALGAVASVVGEDVRGLVASDAIAGELDAAGFDVIEDAGREAWSSRYWSGARTREQWERIVAARKRR